LLVRYALQEYGNGAYRLEWADGLTAALHRLSKPGVDLIILDLGLPESSGPQSYAAIRNAAPDLPVLVLTGDTREETELAIDATGVEDFLVKDEVSGALLLQAIRAGLYTNRRWREQKSSAYKGTQRYHWADEKCRALFALASRMVTLNKNEPVLACVKALVAIVEHYSGSEGAVLAGRADLMIHLERLARSAVNRGNHDLARQVRAFILPPAKSDQSQRDEFDAAMHQRREQLDLEPLPEIDNEGHENLDLAQTLRQILASVDGHN
jgi:CheY-like chemotaxis protein